MFSRKTKLRLPRIRWSLVSISIGEQVKAEDVTSDDLRKRAQALKMRILQILVKGKSKIYG